MMRFKTVERFTNLWAGNRNYIKYTTTVFNCITATGRKNGVSVITNP